MPDYVADPRLSRLAFGDLKKFLLDSVPKGDDSARELVDGARAGRSAARSLRLLPWYRGVRGEGVRCTRLTEPALIRLYG